MATLRESDTFSWGGTGGGSFDTFWSAQTFTPQITHPIYSIKMRFFRIGTPGTVTISIKATDSSGHPTGDDLCSATFDGDALGTSGSGAAAKEVVFGTNPILTAGLKYAIVIRSADPWSDQVVNWLHADTYVNGNIETSVDSGSSWSSTTNDFWFEEYDILTPPVDIVTVRRLVAAANSKIWYEDI